MILSKISRVGVLLTYLSGDSRGRSVRVNSRISRGLGNYTVCADDVVCVNESMSVNTGAGTIKW